jgi:hypothetical protein
MFAVVTLVGVFFGWVGMQVTWIRSRHEFLDRYEREWLGLLTFNVERAAPSTLRLFGEPGVETLYITESERTRIHALFPEADLIVGDPPLVP